MRIVRQWIRRQPAWHHHRRILKWRNRRLRQRVARLLESEQARMIQENSRLAIVARHAGALMKHVSEIPATLRIVRLGGSTQRRCDGRQVVGDAFARQRNARDAFI